MPFKDDLFILKKYILPLLLSLFVKQPQPLMVMLLQFIHFLIHLYLLFEILYHPALLPIFFREFIIELLQLGDGLPHAI